ncbi:FG-GAP-like repeat-containing protein [Mucilaginibacter sp. X5P1]|uniref:FG-GAP-like repeat-containing protein n=1 Tax=Mucilaginibacter sp. X5P1 TaxID=2723088 RepID=UPI001620C190|nr:FG-GAP-like repeat-containing protein [Mucilaginibacter sp. X5P1]MBB6141835.1 hypothetical protein [Mucilaginibacter sp. X5P1]
MKKLILSLLFLLIIISAYSQMKYNKIPGKTFGYTIGSFGVSDGGAATYSIPFVLSPGTCGTAPNLAITYSSQSNNGLLGYGWNLQGLSAITRASQTYAQDGNLTGISLSNTDRFALDGQRMVLKDPAAIYGNDGAVYITEQQTFSKIIETDADFGGVKAPSYFIVKTKSGLTMEYGNTDDSKIRLNGSVPIYWLINKVTDTKGNYYTITYNTDKVTGEYYPDHMDYTGNLQAGLTPYCRVVFGYESRNDVISRYFKGYQMVSCTKRLSSVTSLFKDKVARSYKLYYDSKTVGVSELDSVIESGADGSEHLPVRFRWTGSGERKYKMVRQTNIPCSSTDTLQSLDFNSDGVMDLIKFPLNGNMEIYQGTKDTSRLIYTKVPTNIPIVRNSKDNYLWGDFNGDGRIDLFFWNENSCRMYINQTKSTDKIATFVLIQNPIPIPYPVPGSPSTFVISQDFNGDGRSDLMTVNATQGANVTYFSTMVGYQTFANSSKSLFDPSEFNKAGISPIFADLDGDGLLDAVLCVAFQCKRFFVISFPALPILYSDVRKL